MVPNIVHYIMLRPDGYDDDDQEDMTFLQYLSFLGVHQHIRPTHIVIHGNARPRGEWWRRTASDVANVFFVNVTDVPTEIYGKTLYYIEHRTDLLRYRILYGTTACFYARQHRVYTIACIMYMLRQLCLSSVRLTVRLSVCLSNACIAFSLSDRPIILVLRNNRW